MSVSGGGEGGSGRTSGAVALCMGGSQNPHNTQGASTDGLSYMGRRDSMPLPDILKDVQAFRAMLEEERVECARPFVGKEGSGSLTKRLFLGKLQQLVSDKTKTLFILYWAGHGYDGNGNLAMEGGEEISLQDIIRTWGERPNKQRPNPQRLIWVADSCHSGALVQSLKAIPADKRKTLNIGIQAACHASEVSMGTVFTKAFTLRQLKDKKFVWKATYDKNPSQFDENYQEGTALGPGAHSMQHPTFYHTWNKDQFKGGSEMDFKFFERRPDASCVPA